MPGIAGFIAHRLNAETTSVVRGVELIEEMVSCLKHDDSYMTGAHHQSALGVFVGWSGFRGSDSDCLPIWNNAKDVCLIFSGEHFGDGSGVDARSLIQMYEREGSRFIEKLNGLFSGLVLDLRQHTAILFNDRYGIGRIYYYENNDGVYFSSEAKSLLKVLPTLRNLDLKSLAEVFSCGCVLQNRTLFCGVSLLPCGSMWTFTPGEVVHKGSFFNRQSWEDQEKLSPEVYFEKLKDVFARILPSYFSGRQDVALSLTGGFDSRMILSGAPRLKCYTFVGMYRRSLDAKIAEQIARLCGQPHQELVVDRRFLSEFPELAAQAIYRSDGSAEVQAAAALYANRLARAVAPVRLTGDFGSEVLRGNVAFKPNTVSPKMFSTEFRRLYDDAASTFESERRGSQTSFIVFKQTPWFGYSRYGAEGSQLTLRSPFLDNALVALAFQAPTDLATNEAIARRLIAANNVLLAEVPTDREMSRPRLMPIEVWNRYRSFMQQADYRFDFMMPHRFRKRDRALLLLHVDRMFLGVQKFAHYRTWYRHELAGYVRDILLDERTLSRPYLDRNEVRRLVTTHVNGLGNYTRELHKLLSTELTQRLLIER